MSWELEFEEGLFYGPVNTTLVPELAAELGGSLGTIIGEGAVVVVARDNYPPSRMIKRAFAAGLMSTGVTVLDFHAATTPELVYAIKRLGAKAGVQFTISSVERESIAAKLFDSQGLVFPIDKLEDIYQRAKSKRIVRALPNLIGWVTYAEYIHDIYSAAVASYVDVNSISSKKFTLVCDMNFGPSSEVLPTLLSEAGTESLLLNSHRPPARRAIAHIPSPNSITLLSRLVRSANAALGAAFCADATRVQLIDDEGKPLTSEELVGVVLEMAPSGASVVISEAISDSVEELAKKRGVRIVRVRGSFYGMQKFAKRIGAYAVVTCGNEVAFLDFSPAPDGMLATLKTLELLARTGEQLSSIRERLPKRPEVSTSLKLRGVDYLKVLSAIRSKHRDAIVAFNGVRVRVNGIWVSINASSENLEIVAEESANAQEAVSALVEEVNLMIKEGGR